VGSAVFGLFIGLGLTLLNRVASDVPVIVLGVAGAYAGWLVGVIVFGAVRGTKEQEERN
jgi:glycopeptide antibiotics resistance protein